jgi:hypothetical protein
MPRGDRTGPLDRGLGPGVERAIAAGLPIRASPTQRRGEDSGTGGSPVPWVLPLAGRKRPEEEGLTAPVMVRS